MEADAMLGKIVASAVIDRTSTQSITDAEGEIDLIINQIMDNE
jgi:hypothetical protein